MTIGQQYLACQRWLGVGSVDLYSIQQLLIDHLKLSSIHDLLTQLDCYMIKEDIFLTKFERLKLGEPVAYIVGRTTFMNLILKVNSDVLIPRPETEELVTHILQSSPLTPPRHVIDMGTGSGAIAIVLKQQRPTWKVIATDISEQALSVAKDNAKLHQLDIEFYHGDGFKAMANQIPFQSIDLVVSNPPYVASLDALDPSVKQFEPHMALLAYPQTKFYQQYLTEAKPYLTQHAIFAFEIAPELVDSLTIMVPKIYPNARLKFLSDINQKIRMLMIYT
jgi:release factor glutamine methyltransferase